MLPAHIIFAFLGLAGAYVYGFGFFAGFPEFLHWGRLATLTGLAGLTVTGWALFIAHPERFLSSGKFLSNMTIMMLLVAIELSALVWPLPHLRVASLISWSWIFGAAVWNPPYRYASFIYVYAGVLAAGLLLTYAFSALG